MKSINKKLIFLILAILLLVIFAFMFLKNDKMNIELKDDSSSFLNLEKEESINFELQNYEGEAVSRKDFDSNIIVVNTWATWCPFCVNELPDFAVLQSEFEGVVSVVAINRAEPISVAKSYTDNLELSDSFTFLVDEDDSFYKSIGGFSMPETLFLNKKGEILLHKRGPMKIDEMREVIKSNLSK